MNVAGKSLQSWPMTRVVEIRSYPEYELSIETGEQWQLAARSTEGEPRQKNPRRTHKQSTANKPRFCDDEI